MLLKKNNNYNDKIINYKDVFEYLFKLYKFKFNKLYKLTIQPQINNMISIPFSINFAS